ncbi:MarR family winged helix-turn-helix transcriptional regulator [Rhodoferax aquaticus]|uniref:MarR family winged helix-turn-helix transcriptional regulator n=1 Tax=Rhodoferax aquaticus TaxID=2527691 RepID=UPI003159D5D0
MSYRLHLLHKLTDQESQRAYLAGSGLSLSDSRCLGAVGAFEPLSVNDLARRALLDKAQASRAAQSLVGMGLLLKEDCPNDGRGVVLTLSDKGRTAWRRTMSLIQQRNQGIFGCLSEPEQAQLSTMFDRLIAHARETAAPLTKP